MIKNKLPPCVIMAGGRGKRLGFITRSTPKPIVKIKNKPFIEHQLKWLLKSGFTSFKFLVAYKKQKIIKVIESFFKGKKLKYKIVVDKSKGTFPAISANLKKLDNEFFYTNADEISYFNIKKMYSNFKKSKTNIMCCVLSSNKGNYVLNTKENKIERNMGLNSKLYKDCGYKFIKKKIFKKIKQKKYEKLEEFIYDKYLNNNKVSYFLIKELPLRIDTTFDIRRAKKKIKNV